MNAPFYFRLHFIGLRHTTPTKTLLTNRAHLPRITRSNISSIGVTQVSHSNIMASETPTIKTTVLPVDATKFGSLKARTVPNDFLDDLDIELDPHSVDAQYLRQAAEQLKTSDIPVAFPTETVYGLGADATRSSATKGIYKAKQRPADNPLIVHFASLEQLRALLRPVADSNDNVHENSKEDPIPSIYKPLIEQFCPTHHTRHSHLKLQPV
jgi:L-threonylcarbamoyladenylate synthase